jgi:hypothetical protein
MNLQRAGEITFFSVKAGFQYEYNSHYALKGYSTLPFPLKPNIRGYLPSFLVTSLLMQLALSGTWQTGGLTLHAKELRILSRMWGKFLSFFHMAHL